MKNFKTFTFALLFFFCFIFLSSCQQVEIKSNERGVIFKRFDGGLNPEQKYDFISKNRYRFFKDRCDIGSVDGRRLL